MQVAVVLHRPTGHTRAAVCILMGPSYDGEHTSLQGCRRGDQQEFLPGKDTLELSHVLQLYHYTVRVAHSRVVLHTMHPYPAGAALARAPRPADDPSQTT